MKMMTTDMTAGRSSERGIALVAVMLMVLALSLIGSSLMFVSSTETLSSLNYKTVSQVRYAGESGIHGAANYLLWTYVAPTTGGADPIAAYDLTTSPVRFNNGAVVLSSDPNVASNYPVQAVRNAFAAASAGTLSAGVGTVGYYASATLMSMRQITDVYTGSPVTLQTWQVTGTGTATGAGAAQIQVSATLEHEDRPAYQYAAFATDNGCDALNFSGGATTDSYDSSTYNGVGTPALSNSSGNVGTNGNLTESGAQTTINGSLSTPRSGVGACNANNVNALTQLGNATVTGGVTQLSQAVTFPTPPTPNPAPPTDNYTFQQNSGCAAGTSFCAASANGATITPPSAATIVQLGDVRVNANAVLHLSAGIYQINSLVLNGGGTIVVDGAGPVIFQVVGTGQATPIDLTGGSVSNPTYNPQKLQFIYGGTGTVRLNGGADTSSLIYAPNASVAMSGGADFYGAVIAGRLTETGGATIHYDRNLQKAGTTDGNPVLTQFSWQSY